MKITVCQGCTERYRACWDTCEKYQAARKKLNEKRAAQINMKSGIGKIRHWMQSCTAAWTTGGEGEYVSDTR